MAASLLQLMDELLQNIEQRDAGDPDAPAWEACARIARIEQELARRLNAGENVEDAAPDAVPTTVGTQARLPDESLAGVA